MADETFLEDMRAAVGAFMEADPYYLDAMIITERLKDIESKIDQQVAKIGGIAIILLTPTLSGPLPNIPGANFSQIRFVARHYEYPTTNKTGKTAQQFAIHTAALWSQLSPDAITQKLHPDDPSIVIGNDPKYLAWDTIYLTEGGTKIDIPQLEAPAIDISNPAAVSLSATEPGASVFYTLNNSKAFPRNPAALPFTEPFDASTPGTVIRARAWLAGYIPSAEIRSTT